MWTYQQIDGKWLRANGTLLAIGYSGAGDGKNNPDMQNVENVGPIPCGKYTMELIADDAGNPIDHKDAKGTTLHAPVIRLIPDPTNEMFGRVDFLIHGDNGLGTASLGCPVAARFARIAMWSSMDHDLNVVRGDGK
jgi:hypothetical protein